MSGRITVYRDSWGAEQSFLVPTEAKAALILRCWDHGGFWKLTMRGTPEQLVEAGLADEAMTRIPDSRKQRTGRDEFGDRYVVGRWRGGVVTLKRSFMGEGNDSFDIAVPAAVVDGALLRIRTAKH